MPFYQLKNCINKQLQHVCLLKILALIKRMVGEGVTEGLAHAQTQRGSSIIWKAV